MLRTLLAGAAAGTLIVPSLASAAADPEIAELKKAMAEMRRDYEARLGALEKRLAEAERKSTPARAPASPTRTTPGSSSSLATAATDAAPVAAPSAPTIADSVTAPTRASSATAGASAFNPAISLILEGTAASYSRNPDNWHVPGFQLGGEAGLPPEGLSVGHTELVVSANVDDWFYGQATLAVHDTEDGTELELEEAYVDTLSLPAGFGLRMGRFFPQVGYLNVHHAHTWDFVDAPLPNQAFLGGQWYDDGVRLSWVAPTDLYVEVGIEALRGGQYPVAGETDAFLGDAQNAYLKAGGALGTDSEWQAGLSYLWAEPSDRIAGHGHAHGDAEHVDESFAFSGDSPLLAADLVWKWAPDGNPAERNAVLQAEYFRRHEDGHLGFANTTGSALIPYEGTQQGFYVQGVYQFVPRWRAGLRYDRVWSDNDLRVAFNDSGEDDGDLLRESGLLDDGHDPHRWSAMIDYSHSEFSRLRLQYTRDYTLPEADNQIFLQYVMSLGAHGAHKF
jgi:hypothetical protein